MKLPEIQRSRAQPSQTISPGQAAAPHLAKAKMIGQFAEMAANVNEIKNEYDVNNAQADHLDDITKFKQWMSTRREFSEDEIKAWGLEGEVDVSSGPVPKWKVYTHALAKFTDDSRAARGATISSGAHRNVWEQEALNAIAPEIERSVQEAATMAIEDMALESVDRYNLAVESRNAAAARQALDTYPVDTPKAKAAKQELIDQLQDDEYLWDQQDEYDALIAGGNPEKLREYAATHKDNETVAGTPWDDTEHNKWADKALTAADRMESDLGTSNTKYIKAQQAAALSTVMDKKNRGMDMTWSEDFAPILSEPYAQDPAYVKSIDAMWKSYTDSGGTSLYSKEDDSGVYTKLNNKIEDRSIPYADLLKELNEATGSLRETTWQGLSDKLTARANPESIASFDAIKALVDRKIKTMQIDPSEEDDLQREEAFRIAVDAAVLAKRSEKGGAEPTPEEIRVIVNSQFKLQKEQIVTGRYMGFTFTEDYDDVFTMIAEREGKNTSAVMQELESRIRATGAPINSISYGKAYRVYLKDKKK